MDSQFFRVSGVSKSFDGLVALDGVGFEAGKGQTVGVIGPNGSGKTTLFNIISGLLAADGGSVVFDGTEIMGWKPHRVVRRGIARTFQSARLFNNLTILQNCELPQFTGSVPTRCCPRSAAAGCIRAATTIPTPARWANSACSS